MAKHDILSSGQTDTGQAPDVLANLTVAPGAKSILLPEGFAAWNADFERSGSDLTLTHDGETVLIKGYFLQSPPPDLHIGSENLVVEGHIAARLAGPLTPGQYAQAQDTAQGEPIGKVDTLEGTVTVTRADGTKLELKNGDPVYQGDILETGAGTNVGIVFVDESIFSLGEDGRMVLDELVYDPGTKRAARPLTC